MDAAAVECSEVSQNYGQCRLKNSEMNHSGRAFERRLRSSASVRGVLFFGNREIICHSRYTNKGAHLQTPSLPLFIKELQTWRLHLNPNHPSIVVTL